MSRTVAPENDRVRPPLNLTFLTIESPMISVDGGDLISVDGGDLISGGDLTRGGGDDGDGRTGWRVEVLCGASVNSGTKSSQVKSILFI